MADAAVSDWIGNQERSDDTLSEALAKRIAVLFDRPSPREGQPLPPLWHWAFFQEPVTADQLGRDGHPAWYHRRPSGAPDSRYRAWCAG